MTKLELIGLAQAGASSDIEAAKNLLKILTNAESQKYWKELQAKRQDQMAELKEMEAAATQEWLDSLSE